MTDPNDSQGDGLALDLPSGTRTSDGRSRLLVEASQAIRLGSDPARANAVVVGLAPLHATVAPIKGGGIGMRVEDGSPATLNGAPAATVRLSVGDVIALDGVELRVVQAAPRKANFPDLPGFRIEKQLGRGAMGRVYLAVQEKLGRKVAVKVLDPERCRDAAFVAAFDAEARAAAALHHNNVVTVFDVGDHAGQHYLVLEYMDRGSLEDRLVKEGPLPWRAVLGILRDAAAGLEYAESKGIVHRDIKPANLMQNATGVTKIVDLGLATQIESEGENEGGGTVQGTAHFVAPEQVRGEPVDARADLYALGASGWRLLTSRTPFVGKSAREILRQVLTEPPPSLAGEVEGLPREVDRLIADLMAKDREARPASARAVRERIEQLVVTLGSGATTAAQSAPDAGGSKRPLALLGGIGALVVAGLVAWLAGVFDGSSPPDTSGPGTPPRDSGVAGQGTGRGPAPVVVAPPVDPTPAALNQDAALKELEREARRVLDGIAALDDDELRRERLMELIGEYGGTAAATEAIAQLEALAPAAPTTTTPVATEFDLEGERSRELAARRRASRDASGERLSPQYALRALLLAPVPASLAGDEGFKNQLASLRAEAEAEFEARAAKERDAARGLVDAGDFDAGRAAYQATVDWLSAAPAPATPPNGTAPDAIEPVPPPLYLSETIRALEAEVAALPQLALQFEAAMAHADGLARRAALHGASKFKAGLDALDLESAVAVIDGLRANARSRAGAQWADEMSAWLRPGADFRGLLERTLRAGEWRRRSIAVPGTRRETREVLTIDARGFVLEGKSGTEILALAEFGGSTDLVAALVNERLQREYLPEERAIVAATLVATAIVEGIRVTETALAGKAMPADAAPLLRDGIARARAWTAPGDKALLAELAALDTAAQLVAALATGDTGQAVWASGALIDNHGRTVLVTSLTDGSKGAEPPPWPPIR